MTLRSLRKNKRPSGPPETGRLTGTRDQHSGQVVLLPHRDLTHYSAFIENFFNEYAPHGPTETQLVQVIADCSWRLNRAHAWEDQILALEFQSEAATVNPANPPQVVDALGIAGVVERKINQLDKLSQYAARNSRQFSNALKELLALRSQRLDRQSKEMTAAATLPQIHAEQQNEKPELPPRPKVAYNSKTGVVSIGDLEKFILRGKHRQPGKDNQPFDSAAARSST